MKKIFIFISSIICFLFGFYSFVEASNYQGDFGYTYSSHSTTFWFVDDDDQIDEVYLNIEGKEPINITEYKHPSGVYAYTKGEDLKNKEYYYTVCRDSNCVDIFDPLAKGINTTGDKNVIISNDTYSVSGWENVSYITTTNYNKSIYAIDAQKFTEELVLKASEESTVVDSVFARLSNPTHYGNNDNTTIVGYQYLEKLGMKYIEIGNLYDDNNYFSPNQSFSSKTDNVTAINELKNTIISFKNMKMNVIARVNFVELTSAMASALSSYSPDYVVDGKLNLNNSIMQRYIKEVYYHWINEYKVDGFYILNAELYNKEFLTALISELSTNKNLLIYTDSKELSTVYASDEIQNILFGSLFEKDNTGILTGNFSKSNFEKLVNAMFSGYYNNYSQYKSVGNVINNIGSLDGLDLHSKLLLVTGLGTSESITFNKIKLAFMTIFTSAGIPRVIAGNEYYHNSSIAMEDVDSITSENKVCIEGTKWCYATHDAKSFDWGYLVENGSILSNMMGYRTRYVYQYPNGYTMSTGKDIVYNDAFAESGILYISIGYDADNVGEYERSILLVNYSDKDVQMDAISSRDYASFKALLGSVTDVDGKTSVQGLTFYTFTELKVNNVPNWVYVLITVVLLFIIFGVRALCIKLLKVKRGIDYDTYIREQRQNNKKKKNKEKGPSVFATYLSSDPLFKRKRKEKIEQESKDTKTEDKEVEEKNEEANQ